MVWVLCEVRASTSAGREVDLTVHLTNQCIQKKCEDYGADDEIECNMCAPCQSAPGAATLGLWRLHSLRAVKHATCICRAMGVITASNA